MPTKKARMKRRAQAQYVMLWDELLEGPGRKLIALVAILTAAAYLFGAFKPIIDSGPLPLPSRLEVDDLRKDTTKNFDNVKQGLDQTLEVAKAANVAAQNANQKLDQSRLDRLIQQKIQLEGLLKMNDDPTLKAALEKTQIDIAGMVSTLQAQSGPPTSLTPIK